MHWRRKWQPTPVFLPGESQGRGAWWAAVYGVAQSQTRLKYLAAAAAYCGKSGRFYFLGVQKSLRIMTAAIKLKDACSLEEKL